MLGVIINGAAVLVGGLIGLLFKRGIPSYIEESMNKALGLVVIIIGINGIISNMFQVGSDGSLHSSGELLLVVSFALGTLAGELLKLDDRLNGFSKQIEKKIKYREFYRRIYNGFQYLLYWSHGNHWLLNQRVKRR